MRFAACFSLLFLLNTLSAVVWAADLFTEPYGKLPPNQWSLLHVEDASGGKTFAKAIAAENQIFLWGTGGKKPFRNVYQRYELESFDMKSRAWSAAFPDARKEMWRADDFPPFRIYGQTGPDNLAYDEGPRLRTVGGYHSTNRIQWWDFDGVMRPSPALTFNMACYDTRRKRAIYFADGQTFALDPKTNSWTDLKCDNHPTSCSKAAWAHMAYDADNDRVMLFGGGLATNPAGGCPTWFYDCKANAWQRPKLKAEPPLRCNGALAYSPEAKSFVLFGGYDQAKALSDTWLFDCEKNQWSLKKPEPSPPPMFAPAVAALPGGKVLVCGADARRYDRHHAAASSALKETWVYNVAENRWALLENKLSIPAAQWLTADYSADADSVLMVALGRDRRTLALRYDSDGPLPESPGEPAGPGEIAWKYAEQKESLESAPPADPAAHAKVLKALPANTFVNADPPGVLVSKTWSTATIDTDRSEVIYTGGGHSGYSGNDIARYDIAANRWSQDAPPRFPPFLEGTNAGIYGWSYGMIPFSQHTYLWYDYDPVSKSVLYLARPSVAKGDELQLTPAAKSMFVYDPAEHGYASWVYDSANRKMHRPSFGRPFKNEWHTTVKGTPHGVFVLSRFQLYRARISPRSGAVTWKLIDDSFPKPKKTIKYHYEFQPLLYDSTRERLIQLKGDANRVDVFARPLTADGAWEQLAVKGSAAVGREAVYIPKHDTILWLGNRLYELNLKTNAMKELKVDLPEGLYGHECAMVYDPKHDVCVALIPKQFSGPMQTFLFRYSR